MSDLGIDWTEEDSRTFIEKGMIFTPAREEIAETIVRLIPAGRREDLLAVDIAAGTGWLSEAILDRLPGARLILLDGSEAMLEEARGRLKRYAGRTEFRRFRLEDSEWRDALPDGVRCFVSSLAIHHLDGDGKARLYADLYERLAEPGVLLIADIVAPRSDLERLQMADAWDREVREQSLAGTDSLDAYNDFLRLKWNWHRYPDDPMDKPSSIPQHLNWLSDAGFENENVFWLRAGHAIYGGYKGLEGL